MIGWGWKVEKEEKSPTGMCICTAAASMFSISSVPSLAWSLLSHVQSVTTLASYLSHCAGRMYEVCVKHRPLSATMILTWLVPVVSNYYVAVEPPLPTRPTKTPQPCPLLPIRPRLPNIRGTDRISVAQYLQISRALALRKLNLMHHHVHIASILDMTICDPVRSAKIIFRLVKGHEAGGFTVGLGWAVISVIEGDADTDYGVDACEVEGEVWFKIYRDDADGGILEDREDVDGLACPGVHDRYGICGF